MPTYRYRVILPDGEDGMEFEVVQRMADPPLTVHPTTGQPVERVLCAPHIGGGSWSETGMKNNLSDKRLAELGMSKYVKSADGKYEKAAGPDSAPKSIG